jgi:hypothetical protein
MDFLIQPFTVLGVEFQIWMPLFLAAGVAALIYAWKADRR